MDFNRFCREARRDLVKSVITGADHIFGPWLAERTGGRWVAGQGSTIGLVGNGEICGAVLFEAFNGASIMMHCAGEGKKWLNREFLWFVFYYPFVQLNAKVIISPVESSNLDCIRFIEHIGFKAEATLRNASLTGDLLIYTMGKESCRWLSLKRSKNVEAESAYSA